MQKVRAEIHLGNIKQNALTCKAACGGKLYAVVKANAYGHGDVEVVNALSGIADGFAVALIDEGIRIKTAACGKDILVFTPPITQEEVYYLAVNGLIVSVGDLWTAKLVAECAKRLQTPIKAHLKVNTGMNRYGMNVCTLGKVCKFLQTQPLVQVQGIYSHLHDCEIDSAYWQRELFLRAVDVCRRYFPSVIAHLGGTYAALLGKEFALDATRVGLGLYGYLPACKEKGALSLKKGMKITATTVASRAYRQGAAGYGKPLSKAKASKIKRLSVCRFGYADGFLRQRKNGVDGWQTHAGALCMDVCVRADSARRGKQVVLLSDAEKIAKETGTIPYEVLCAATRRAEMIFYEE